VCSSVCEAREADLGLAGGKGVGLIFRRGKIVRKVPEAQLLEAFWEELQRLLREESGSGEIRGLTSGSGELN